MTNAITAYVDRIVSGLTFHGEKPNQAVEGDCYFSNADDGFMIFEQGAWHKLSPMVDVTLPPYSESEAQRHREMTEWLEKQKELHDKQAAQQRFELL